MDSAQNECLNCGAELQGEYCYRCGQSAQVSRITFADTIRDFFSSSFALEGPLFTTIKLLLLNPGRLFREFLSGKRKTYYKPVAFFVVLSATYIITRSLIGYDPFQGRPPVQDAPVERKVFNDAALFMVKNINNIMFILVLGIGLGQKLFFRKSYLLAEYLVMGFYVSGIYIGTAIPIIIFSVYVHFINTQINLVLLTAFLLYSSYSLHLRKSFWSFLKYAFATAFSILFYMIVGYAFSLLIVYLKGG